MKLYSLSLLGCLMLIQGCALFDAGGADANRKNASTVETQLHSPELAFSITVQQPWQIQVKDARLLDRKHTAEIQESSVTRPAPSSAPLLIVSIPDGKTLVPPTIQVNYREKNAQGKTDPVELLEQQLYYLRSAYQGFSYQSEPELVHTSTHYAACARFKTQSNVELGGKLQEENVMMKFCLIPRGDLMFMIAIAADAESFPKYQSSFDEMLESVRL